MQRKVLFSVRQHDFSLSESCGVFLFECFRVDFVGFVGLFGDGVFCLFVSLGFFCFLFGWLVVLFESSFLKLPPDLVI